MGKAKYWKGLTAAGIVLAVVLVVIVGISVFPEKNIKEYEETEEVFGNPLMGYAPCAWNETVSEDVSLLYMDITWAELEPKEGEYNWESIEKENQLSRWKKEGKHIILRFVCDVPGKKNIWIFRSGCMKRPVIQEPGMMWNLVRVLLRIITMNR